ncbi:MAG: PAS domain-containing sensor histidine kinase [Candidatus Falkowbacteria bacterium]
MNKSSEDKKEILIKDLKLLAKVSSVLLVVLGVLVIIGWVYNIGVLKSVIPGLMDMKVNAAICIILVGLSLCLYQWVASKSYWRNNIIRLFSLTILFLSSAAIYEYFSGQNTGLDQLIIKEAANTITTAAPGRMAFTSALGFLLTCIGLFFLSFKTTKFDKFIQFLALIVGVDGMICFFAYIYGSSGMMFGLIFSTAMALHAAIAFIVISFALLFSTSTGFMIFLTEFKSGSIIFRKLLLISIIIPLAFGWLQVQNKNINIFEFEYTTAIIVVINIIITLIFLKYEAKFINRYDEINLRTEEQLRENNYILNEAQKITNIGSYVLDIRGDVWTSSETLDKIFGIDDSYEHSTATWVNLVYPDDREMMANYFSNEVLGKGKFFDKMYRINKGGGTWVYGRGRLEFDKDGKPIKMIGTIQDITEQRQTEIRLMALDKLKDDFLSTTTHELKSPLVPIKAQAQLLLAGDYGKLTRNQKSAVEMIYKNEEALRVLTGDIFDITKIRSSKLKLILEKSSVEKIVASAINSEKNIALEKQITILLLPVPVVPLIQIDVPRITQVLNNLLENAIKFSPENSKVTVEIKKGKNDVVVMVCDNGIGIAPANINKLFIPFSQIDSDISRKYRGTGLGLAICKGIVEAHKGKIWIESEGLGKGTKVSFSLPIKTKLK